MIIQGIAKTAMLVFLSLTLAKGTLVQASLAQGTITQRIDSQVSAAQVSADNPEQDTTPKENLPDQLAIAVTKQHEMVVTANPIATAAGERILRAGGTAADAMIAVQAILGLVEPQSSGIGGGAFIVYYDARANKITTIDARETAPAAATGDRFAAVNDTSPTKSQFVNAWQSGLSVGVPGVPRMLEFMHERYGFLPIGELYQPAITLAQQGFALTTRTSNQVSSLLGYFDQTCDARLTFRDPTAFKYFANADCSAKPAGTIVKNPDYAQTLIALSRFGADAFYTGAIAANIVAAVQGDLHIAGDMTLNDLANYQVIERAPVCMAYRGRNVCGMGPPSSGALAVGQILGILQSFDFSDKEPLNVDVVHLFSQAGRLAFADRGRYVADPDFVTVPTEGLLNEAYLAARAALISETDLGVVEAGTPPGEFDLGTADERTKESGTSHVSIIDRYGNALSMTTTVESSFGNGVMVNGFLLNNQLTDFSFKATGEDGVLIANRVQANKRPRSSMSPTIVFDEHGRVEIVTGSPGGSRIIGYTAQSIFNMIEFDLDPQQAINVPHYMNRNGRTDLEQPIPGITWNYDALALAAELRARGHSDPGTQLQDRQVGIIAQASGLSIIKVERRSQNPSSEHFFEPKKVLIGGADKRRDGAVGGR
jgi:gamma-glutamyltranspeptidase/glutathione hydrolase